MFIKLDDEWTIEECGSHYVLRQYTGKTFTDKQGNVIKKYDYEKFPPTLEGCVKKYIHNVMSQQDVSLSLMQYVTQFKDTYERIRKEQI